MSNEQGATLDGVSHHASNHVADVPGRRPCVYRTHRQKYMTSWRCRGFSISLSCAWTEMNEKHCLNAQTDMPPYQAVPEKQRYKKVLGFESHGQTIADERII